VNTDRPVAGRAKPSKTRWLKRQALQLSGMLPEDPEDARRVIGYMRELQAGFLAEEAGNRQAGGNGGIVVGRIAPKS